MKVINLLPKSELKELQLQLASRQLFAFFLLISSSLVALFVLALAARFYLEGNISQSKAEVTRLQEQLSSSNNQVLEKQVQALNAQIHNVDALNSQRYYWSKALIELGNISPDGLHLNSMNVDRLSGKIDIEGIADRRDDVILFWSNVKKSSYFTGIDFPLNNLEKPVDTPFKFSFSIQPNAVKIK